jgi:hypothetical protein
MVVFIWVTKSDDPYCCKTPIRRTVGVQSGSFGSGAFSRQSLSLPVAR